MKTKAFKILKTTSGASLIFVLGIMLLLMAVSTSVIAAASANVGANVRQRQYNRALLLNDSIHRNVQHSLMMDPSDSGYQQSLANQIARDIYNANEPRNFAGGSIAPIEEIELDIAIAGTIIDSEHSITLEFLFQEVRIAGPVGYIPELGSARVPRTASLSARMVVTVTVEVESATVLRNDSRIITSQAVYEYSGGVFSDETVENTNVEDPDIVFPMAFTEFGEWKMVSYEIVES